MRRARLVLASVLLFSGCEPDRSSRWTNPFEGMFAVSGFVRDQHGAGVNGVELRLVDPAGVVRLLTTRHVSQWGDAGWFETGFFTGRAGEHRLTIVSVPAGFTVPESQPNPVVLHFDERNPGANLTLAIRRSP